MGNNKKHIALTILLSLAIANIYAQNTRSTQQATKTENTPDINKLRAAVEAKPNDFDTHFAYIRAMKFDSPDLIKQYNKWIKKYPRSVMFPYAIGETLKRKENPKAKPYLMKALEIDPNYAKAYMALSSDAGRWGDFKAADAYLLKAKELDPNNADYAFSYALSFEIPDPEMYKKLSLEVARNFPNTEAGSQALYWLANQTKNPKEKTIYYEQQRKDFPVEQFSWTNYGMLEYFNLLLLSDPPKAKALARSIADQLKDDKTWQANLVLGQNIEDVNKFLSQGKAAEALAIFDKVVVPQYSQYKDDIILFKSKVLDAANNTAEAYQTLIAYTAKEPTAKINAALINYGKKLGKDEKLVNKDILYARDTASRQAPDFTLETYLKKGVSSLADYKGKVILLTYWFPGCGPCRGEFPHFENVVRKFKGEEFVYLGINIVEAQDEYVMPFMKSSGYSFIPLKDNKNWEKGPLNHRGLAPVNFLIDQNGRIIFSWFRTDSNNEATLELMISSLLTGKAI